MLPNLKHFKFWCQKVLPLVYDDSLSYYEVLCKVVDYINNIIADMQTTNTEITELQNEINQIKMWIENFETTELEKLIAEKIATMIFIEISNAGYIIYHVPEQWEDITFNTTGLDIMLADYPEYGRLVLSY